MNRSFKRLLEALAVTPAIVVFFSGPSHAYIDPGTGSFVVQAAIAGLLGAAFVVKSTWRNITSSVGRLFGRRGSEQE